MNAKELLAAYASGERDFRGISLIQADLTGADLQGIDLSGAQLCFTVFSHANLTRANFSHANLNGAELLRATLQQANFSKAQMIGTNLSMAILNHAELSETILSWTNFSKANLDHANLTRASLDWTAFVGANLSHARLTEARLSGANLHKANLTAADISGLDLSEGNRIPLVLPDGSRYTPEAGGTALLDLERFLGTIDEEMYRKQMAQAQETAVIKEFLKGKFELLGSHTLQTKETFDAVQLWSKRGELVASLKLNNATRRAIVKHTSEHWGLVDQILRDQNFIPIGVSKYEGYLDYEYQDVPPGYQLNFTEARFLWRAWRKQQTLPQAKELFLFDNGQWHVVQSVISSEGALFVSTDAAEVSILYAGDGAVWLSPISEQITAVLQ